MLSNNIRVEIMEEVNALASNINEHLSWNQARITSNFRYFITCENNKLFLFFKTNIS